MNAHAVLPLAGLLLGTLGAGLVARAGRRLGLLDRPSARSSHATPTPKGGGVGIVAAFVLTGIVQPLPPALTVAGAALAGVSLLSDRIHLAPALRMLVHLACAAALLPTLGLPAGLAAAPLGAAALLFIAGTANYFNFMDGSNGMAGLAGVVAFALLAYVAHASGHPAETALCATVAAACLGFLPWNAPRARVFMGDVSSVLLGFLFARTVIVLSYDAADLLTFAAFLFPFYADVLITMAVRLRAGERLSHAHRRHLYQILVNQRRWPHLRVALCYALVQLLVAAAALALRPHGVPALIGGLAVVSAFAAAVAVLARNRWERPTAGGVPA